MSEKTTKRETYTFFNEEWNQPFWEDGADVLDQRNHNKNSLVED